MEIDAGDDIRGELELQARDQWYVQENVCGEGSRKEARNEKVS